MKIWKNAEFYVHRGIERLKIETKIWDHAIGKVSWQYFSSYELKQGRRANNGSHENQILRNVDVLFLAICVRVNLFDSAMM